MRKLYVLVAIIASITLIITGCTPTCPDVGSPAPNFTLQTPDGESISLSDFQGKLVMLNFWSTRCGPCVVEMPHIQAVHEEWANQGLVVLAINISDNAATAQAFIESKGLTFPTLLDPQMNVFGEYCLPQAIPITLFINTEGIIKARKVGAFQSPTEIESLLKSL